MGAETAGAAGAAKSSGGCPTAGACGGRANGEAPIGAGDAGAAGCADSMALGTGMGGIGVTMPVCVETPGAAPDAFTKGEATVEAGVGAMGTAAVVC